MLDDLRKLQARQLKLKESRSELRGSMASEEKHAADLITQLTGERYRRIDERHTNALIDVRTNVLANADLELYHKALDKALMSFHSIKMKEINESLTTHAHQTETSAGERRMLWLTGVCFFMCSFFLRAER